MGDGWRRRLGCELMRFRALQTGAANGNLTARWQNVGRTRPATKVSNRKFCSKQQFRWREPELNRRHHDFQSCALPTELSRHVERNILAESPSLFKLQYA